MFVYEFLCHTTSVKWYYENCLIPMSVCVSRTLGMSVAWLQCLWLPSLIFVWLLPSFLLSGTWSGSANGLLSGRSPLLLQSQPPQPPEHRPKLYPASQSDPEPCQGQRGARCRTWPAWHWVTLLFPYTSCKVRSCWLKASQPTSNLSEEENCLRKYSAYHASGCCSDQ